MFYVFAALTLGCALLVVANPFTRSPVTGAMFLLLTVLSMAGLFVLLHAFFLAAVQILVYAGAVMVVFIFVIMLLDLKEEERRKLKLVTTGAGGLAVMAVVALFLKVVWVDSKWVRPVNLPTLEGSTNPLGTILFKQFLLPFEILSVLLLVAMVGVILLSKKDLR